MSKIIQNLKDFFLKREPLPQGFHNFHTPPEDPLQYRLHLRIEPDGTGVLIVNASTILHLNQSATEYAYEIVQGKSNEDAIHDIGERYAVAREQIEQDFYEFRDQVMTLITIPDLDPVSYLGMDRDLLYSSLTAPYRLDCALTYRVNYPDASVAPQERVTHELSTEEWCVIIRKAFDAGIPHLVFTGGEPNLRDDLAEILDYCEKLGLVTGLLSEGYKLGNPDFLQSLLDSGLDHLMFVPNPEDESDWNSLQLILAEDLFTTVHLTLTPGKDLTPFIDRLAEMKVNAVSLSASDPSLKVELKSLQDYVSMKQMELVWDLPVPYSNLNPIALELEDDEIRQGAGAAWLYIEPDGDVLPAQGVNHLMGNLLEQPWEQIWKNRPIKE